MAQSRGDASFAVVVQGTDAKVAQRQLNLAHALLLRHTTRHGAVHLVGEPVFAGHGFHLQHIVEVFMDVTLGVADFLEMIGLSLVIQYRLRCAAEEVGDSQVDGSLAFLADETQALVASHLAHLVIRGALTLGGLLDDVLVLLVDQEAHALLRLVTDDLLVGQGRVANGQVVDVHHAARVLDEFAEAVEVAACTVVVDAADGVVVALSHGADDVAHTLLHLGVGTLHGIQLDGVAVLARVDTRHGAAAHTDAVVVAAQHDDDVALFGFQLLGILHLGEADAASQHDDLVVAQGFLFAMLKGQQAAVDEGLAELVAEVGGTIGGLDENLFRCLIQPLARLDVLLPFTALLRARIGSHINGSARQRQTALTAGQTVANLAAATSSCTIERLHGRRKVMCFGFQ